LLRKVAGDESIVGDDQDFRFERFDSRGTHARKGVGRTQVALRRACRAAAGRGAADGGRLRGEGRPGAVGFRPVRAVGRWRGTVFRRAVVEQRRW
jgi:hypothetical protein